MDHRYLNEDVGYELMFVSELGKELGIKSSMIDSVINVASVVMKIDYRGECVRTLEKLIL